MWFVSLMSQASVLITPDEARRVSSLRYGTEDQMLNQKGICYLVLWIKLHQLLDGPVFLRWGAVQVDSGKIFSCPGVLMS